GLLAAGAGALYAAEFGGWGFSYAVMAALMTVGMVGVLRSPEPTMPPRRVGGFFRTAVVAPFVDFFERHGRPSGGDAHALNRWLGGGARRLRQAIVAIGVCLLYVLLLPVLGVVPAVALAVTRRFATIEWFWLVRRGLAVIVFIILYKFGEALAGVMANPL